MTANPSIRGQFGEAGSGAEAATGADADETSGSGVDVAPGTGGSGTEDDRRPSVQGSGSQP